MSAGRSTGERARALIAARGLHTYYGASHVLHGVDFAVGEGETVGLMGRNGMGKTTLLRTLLGILAPRAGSVEVDGLEMTRVAPHVIARRGIAYVPEGRGIFPNLSVRENLLMAARAGVDGRRAWTEERVLATFPRLAQRLRHGGAQLSGGEQQMLTIGRALMTNPRPADPRRGDRGARAADRAGDLVDRAAIKDDGIASVIVDKNYRAVTAIADRAVILVKGAVAFEGPSAQVRSQPELRERFLGV